MKSKRIIITIACFILGLTMTWQYRSEEENNRISSKGSERYEDLVDDFLRKRELNDILTSRIAELEEEISDLENSKGDNSLIEANLMKEWERARLVAGLTNVKGEGIVITIDNDVGIVTDSDILSIINELRASEAQAISVNGQRIISVSEVREAGNYIVINGKRMWAPFKIKAIANATDLENALNMRGGVIEKMVELYKLKCTITT